MILQPTPTVFHCVTTALNSKVMVIGGSSNGSDALQQTYYLHPLTGEKTLGPDLNIARGWHGCATIATSSITVVAGGWDGNDFLASVEILVRQGKWTIGMSQ